MPFWPRFTRHRLRLDVQAWVAPIEITGVSIIGYVAGTCTTLAFLPQVFRTWQTRSTQDISLGMFSLMVFGIALWLFYGIVIGDWPLIVADGVSLLLAASILWMKVRYG